MEPKIAVAALSALAHETRLAVFRMLVTAGPDGVAAGEIARSLNVPPNTLSSNLTILANADLITSRRAGRSIIYSAQFSNMGALLEYLVDDCCAGSPEICGSLAEVASRTLCEPAGAPDR